MSVIPTERGSAATFFWATWSPRRAPSADDFATDLGQAIAGKAAGWCFHNGDQRGQQPRRSFDLRQRRLFEQLDGEEKAFLDRQLPEVMKRTSNSST
jgi:hypothetical protein